MNKQSIKVAEHKREVKTEQKTNAGVNCPHCECSNMVHTVMGETHIYSCSECPNVMLEYISNRSLYDLIRLLEGYKSSSYNELASMLSR